MSAGPAAGPRRLPLAAFAARLRTSAWLGWQIEANWADPFTFILYSLARPLALALILAVMYRAVAGQAAPAEVFLAFYFANAFHEYVVRMVVGMGWVVVEEREEYETLKSIVVSPIGMFTYLWGRSAMKFVQATVSVVLVLTVGWFGLGLRWDWGGVAWGPVLASLALGWTAVLYFGFLVAGWALVLPRIAISVNEGVAVALYLLSGVIFPIDLMPRALQLVSLLLPFTHWYEALRRFVLGRGASELLAGWSDATLLAVLAASTLAMAILSTWGYRALEWRARRDGRIDQTTLF